MKKIIALAFITSALSMNSIAQNCKAYFPMEKGSKFEMTSYDHKNKLTGKVKQEVLEKVVTGNDVESSVKAESYDEKDKLVYTNTYNLKCSNGVFMVDMKSMMPGDKMGSYNDMELSIESGNIILPSDPKVGDELPESTLKMSVSLEGVRIMSFTIRIYNRKVTAIESVTTVAGEFHDCIKISYDIETVMMIKTEASAEEWYALDMGLVYQNSYNKRGKLVSHSELTSIQK